MTLLRRFEMHQPASVEEASRMLAQYGEEAGVYAGGTELLLAMKHQALNYPRLIDVKVIPGLDRIDLQGDVLSIGATATHRSIERSPLVRQHQPVLAEMESGVANIRVRATGTLGGNLCFAEPHSDPATLLLALEGKVRTEGSNGVREMPISEFITGPYSNSLLPGEILTHVLVPCARPDERAAYLKFQVHERPMLGLALWMRGDDGVIRDARVAVGCACPFPRRSRKAEKLLTGERAQVEQLLPDASEILARDAELVSDHEGSAEYKAHLIQVLLKRAFRKALDRTA